MNNAVVMCVFNNLELTKQAVASVLAQDIPVDLWIMDNGSTDGTSEWLCKEFIDLNWGGPGHTFLATRSETNKSPVKVANLMMKNLFDLGHEHILGLPNDAILPPNAYREMLKWPRGVVTASMSDVKDFPIVEEARAVNECTPMAVVMIRRWVYQALMSKDGYFFDERYFHYASDLDFALRLSACGIRGIQLDLQYWHFCSASWRKAPYDVARKITHQADLDRDTFESLWGFKVEDPEYQRCAGDINFKGIPKNVQHENS